VTEQTQTVLDAAALAEVVRRLTAEIAQATHEAAVAGRLGIVGIARGGSPVAQRLADELLQLTGLRAPVGTLDITWYRDDAASTLPDPKLGPNRIDWDIEGTDVVLVDDVLHTGRTVRAAIDSVFDHGRPRRIWLCVLCDRGGRQLPIAADFVGKHVSVPSDQPGAVLKVVAEGGPQDGAFLRVQSSGAGAVGGAE